MRSSELFQMKSIWKIIVRMSIPSLISIIVMLLYNMADMYFVGWTGDYSQVASVSLVMPVFTMMMAVSTMLSNGGCTLIAQAFGRKKEKHARIYASLCVWGAIGFGILFAVLLILFCNPMLRFLGANKEMWNYTKIYLLVMAAGAPVVLLNHTLGGVLRGEGAAKEGMYGGLISTATNIVLDPIFIMGFGLGVGGAAIATVIGNGAGILYYVWYRKSHETILSGGVQYAKQNVRALGSILALGMPNAISSLLSGFASTFSNRLLASYGTSAVAAMAAAGKVTMIIAMVQMGICMGVHPFLAYCHGAGDNGRMKEVIRKLTILTAGLGITSGILGFAAKYQIVGLFIQDVEVLILGGEMVKILILTSPFIGMFYIGMHYMQATGHALGASIVSVLRQGALLLPFLYMMERLFQMTGIAIAHIAADGIAILISVSAAFYYAHKSGSRQKNPDCEQTELHDLSG